MLGHLRNVALLLRAQRTSRHKNYRIGGLMFDKATPSCTAVSDPGNCPAMRGRAVHQQHN